MGNAVTSTLVRRERGSQRVVTFMKICKTHSRSQYDTWGRRPQTVGSAPGAPEMMDAREDLRTRQTIFTGTLAERTGRPPEAIAHILTRANVHVN